MRDKIPFASVGSACGIIFSIPALAAAAFSWGGASGLNEWTMAPLEASLASVSCSCWGATGSLLLAMVGGGENEQGKEGKLELELK